ncbi:MAG: alpha/beta fold hydrolase [Burkholderiaceae bacterium]|nr:alpha/beta fold hydrolase [Burkholderiaceae bacterium]
MRPATPHEVMPAPSLAGAREREHSPWLGRSGSPSEALRRYQAIERAMQALSPLHASTAVSPATAAGAFLDWAMHLAASPAKQWELWEVSVQNAVRWVQATCAGPADNRWCIDPLPQDKRFDDPEWRERPFAWYAQALLLQQAWWQHATTGVPGVTHHHERMVDFAARQWLDMVSPSNSVIANPVVLRRTIEEGGANLARGALHAMGDAWREWSGLPPYGTDRFKLGVDVAATPGRVVLRNALIELIQYTPTTPTVQAEPVLIVPAWIMKYYVLDLEPHNSMVKFLVDAGFTVYAISWKNPQPEDRDLGLDDYHRLGVRAALDAIDEVAPSQGVHAVGYCLGGTLLAMVAALLGREKSPALKTMTLLAAQVDFTDPGELSLFIDESQVAWFESQMARQGVLTKAQMRATFQMLRSRDLVWSYRLSTYLMGERTPVNALMAWNADGTHLPYRMHSEYLHALYLDNALAHGEYRLGGVPISLSDIRTPIFSVGAVQDHVAPWRSVFKLHQFTAADQTFVLTAGGHNVGIVNPPGQAKSSYRLRHWKHVDRLLTPDEWLEVTESVQGSWWTPWAEWLKRHSSGPVAPPAQRPSLGPAPGTYVFLK